MKNSTTIVWCHKWIFVFISIFFLASSVISQLPSGFIRERIATGLNPTALAYAPDGRIFITEKNGTIRIIRDDELLEEPMFSIDVDDSNERGLGHMVLHPDFDSNGYFYLYYTVEGRHYNRISRFTANGDKVIPGSELVLLELDPANADVHNGGAMLFGKDGYLYVSTGDGAQHWKAEDPGSTHGKILRITDNGSPVADNPWYASTNGRANLVYAYGLRNPFTMAIHPVTGDIYANDVGGSNYEEINKIEKGSFYGWPKVEGKASNQDLPAEYRDPIYQYGHVNGYCCIAGSSFYHPDISTFPPFYKDRYFYSDYCKGAIRMLDVSTGKDVGIFISDGDRVVDLLVTRQGALYYLERKGLGDGSAEDNSGTNEGTLWKVTYTGSGAPFISLQPEPILVSEGEVAIFSVTATGAFPITYRWWIDGVELLSNNQSAVTIDNTTAEMDSSQIYVDVINDFGIITSDTVLLRVTTNHRPEPLIHLPLAGATYKAGEKIHFSGSGYDPEDGILTSESMSWKIDFHHGTHSHPAMSWTENIAEGEWDIPSSGETSADVFYRIQLKITDSEGLVKVIYRDVFPEMGAIKVETNPAGLIIELDGTPSVTPYFIEGVEGISRYLSPPYNQVSGDSIYFFSRWSDGSFDRNREVKANEEDQVFEGLFKGYALGKGSGLTIKYFDNIFLEGEPVATSIDSFIDNQYFFGSPHPLLPDDFFSIQWKGYIQAYQSGVYQFSVSSDDGIYLEIGETILVNSWEPGVHFETATKYLESGKLYPIEIRMFEDQWGAQTKLKWSGPDFNDEIIRYTQLYPEDYISSPTVSGILSTFNISAQSLEYITESFKEIDMEYQILSVTGQVMLSSTQFVSIGKNTGKIDISMLPAGIYFFNWYNKITEESTLLKFVKPL